MLNIFNTYPTSIETYSAIATLSLCSFNFEYLIEGSLRKEAGHIFSMDGNNKPSFSKFIQSQLKQHEV